MKKLLLITLVIFTLHIPSCAAQDLTVHVIDMKTNQPFKNVRVGLRYTYNNGKWVHYKENRAKTDKTGVAVFHSLTLNSYTLCVLSPDPMHFDSKENGYCFGSNEAKKLYTGIATTIPAEVTFHVHRYSFTEYFTHGGWSQFWPD
jgi:hypothetical protein